VNSKKLETPLERSILPLARSQHGGSIVDKAVDLQGRPIAIEDDELIEDLARFADGIERSGREIAAPPEPKRLESLR
jgi:hypothetical protein